MHQALEAKEKIQVQAENQTLASITYQNYFKLYKKISGCTGTAATEAAEFYEIYNLPVVIIPTNNPMIRTDHNDQIFRTEEEKILFEKINEIRKAFTVKESNKDYENLLIRLSETKQFTDDFFNNVVVNDENQDIKNNRLELLKMFCNTFNSFINFSKLEGI